MIVLNVTYKCKPGMNKKFLDQINAEGIGAACRAEEGNIRYDYYFPADGSDELTAADKTLQVAAYEFILDRRLNLE